MGISRKSKVVSRKSELCSGFVNRGGGVFGWLVDSLRGVLLRSKDFAKKINGDVEYKKYLGHFKQHHKEKMALTKREFFAKKEQEKWGKINRCC